MNTFDRLARQVVDTTTRVMGYDATWSGYSAVVHLNTITKLRYNVEIEEVNHDPDWPIMEYRAPFFPGLFEAVRAKQPCFINITVDGVVKEYEAYHSLKMWDGNLFHIVLIPL